MGNGRTITIAITAKTAGAVQGLDRVSRALGKLNIAGKISGAAMAVPRAGINYLAGAARIATTGAIVGLTVAFGEMASTAFDSSVEIENAALAFREIYGNAKQANVAMESAQSLVGAFDFTTIVNFERRLAGAGIKAKDLGGTTKGLLGTMSAFGLNAETSGRAMNAFAQMLLKGKIQSEEMTQQLAESGIPVWKILAESMGKSVQQVQDLSKKGKLGQKEVLAFFETLKSKYGDVLDKRLQTLGGRAEQFANVWKFQVAKAFEPVLNVIKERLPAATKNISNLFDALKPEFQLLAKGVDMLFDAWMKLPDAIRNFNKWLGIADSTGKSLLKSLKDVDLYSMLTNAPKGSVLGFLHDSGWLVTNQADIDRAADDIYEMTKGAAEKGGKKPVKVKPKIGINWEAITKSFEENSEFIGTALGHVLGQAIDTVIANKELIGRIGTAVSEVMAAGVAEGLNVAGGGIIESMGQGLNKAFDDTFSSDWFFGPGLQFADPTQQSWVGDWIKGMLGPAEPVAKEKGNAVGSAFASGTRDGTVKGAPAVQAGTRGITNAISTTATSATPGVLNAGRNLGSAVGKGVASGVGQSGAGINPAVTKVGTTVSTGLTRTTPAVVGAANKLSAGLGNALKAGTTSAAKQVDTTTASNRMRTGMSTTTAAAKTGTGTVVSAMTAGLRRAVESTQAGVKGITSAAARTGPGVSAHAGAARAAGGSVGTAVSAGLRSRTGVVTTAGASLVTGVPGRVTAKTGAMRTAGVGMGGAVATGIGSSTGKATAAGTAVASAGRTGAASQQTTFTSIGTNMVSGMISGMQSLAGSLMSTARTMASNAASAAKAALRIKSPSRVFKEIGEFVVEGFILGVTGTMDDVKSVMVGMGDLIVNLGQEFKDALSEARQERKDAAAELKEARKELDNAQSKKITASKKNKKSYANALASHAEAIREARLKVKEALKEFKGTDKELEALLEFKSTAGNSKYLKHLQKKLLGWNKQLLVIAQKREVLAAKIEAATSAVEDAIRVRDDFASSVSDSVKATGALESLVSLDEEGTKKAPNLADFKKNLQDKINAVNVFRQQLAQLDTLGLNDAMLKQLYELGPDAGREYAQAILNGTAGDIGDLNVLQSKLEVAADALGKQGGNDLYQAGVDSATKLLDGLNAKDAELKDAAAAIGKRMRDAFRDAFDLSGNMDNMLADWYAKMEEEFGVDLTGFNDKKTPKKKKKKKKATSDDAQVLSRPTTIVVDIPAVTTAAAGREVLAQLQAYTKQYGAISLAVK